MRRALTVILGLTLLLVPAAAVQAEVLRGGAGSDA